MQTSKKANQPKKAPKHSKSSKVATEEWNGTKDSSLRHIEELSSFNESIREWFHSGYTSVPPLEDSVSKGWSVDSRMGSLLCDTALGSKCPTVAAFLQACRVDKSH